MTVPLSQSPAVAVHQLDAALVPTAWHRLTQDRLVGDASQDSIRIRRIRPFWRNDFSPEFIGSVRPGGQAIEGSFRPSRFARGFMTVWLGALLVLFLPVELTAVVREGLGPLHRDILLTITGMALFGIAMPWVGWWLGRSDIPKIEEAIRRAAQSADA